MDLKSVLATQGYAATRPATATEATAGDTVAPVGEFARALQQREEQAVDALTTGADPMSLVQALAETQLAVEAAVTVRDRVVEAYQEILRMPV
ncbi:MAG: flagellar hook-basal body complex protein FliE [Pseudomonadota bacterium]